MAYTIGKCLVKERKSCNYAPHEVLFPSSKENICLIIAKTLNMYSGLLCFGALFIIRYSKKTKKKVMFVLM
jgi:hypothetical protein